MERRKVQEVGGGTFTVSIPLDWAESENISQGTVVDLHTHIDGLLVIQVGDRDVDPTGHVTIPTTDKDPDWLRRAVRAAYAAGFEEITFTPDDQFTDSQRKGVLQVARSLTGLTVTTENETELTLQALLDPEEVSVQQSVRQLRFIALGMHRDATAAMVGEGPTESLMTRDDEADRVYALIDRSFSRALSRLDEIDALGQSRPELFTLWYAVHELERIADHAERIMAIATELDDPIPVEQTDELETIAELAREVVESAVSVVIDDANLHTAKEALSLRDRVRERTATLNRRLFEISEADYRLTRVLDSLQRTAEHGSNIAERGIQAMIRRNKAEKATLQEEENEWNERETLSSQPEETAEEIADESTD
ncbi:MAG: PhoU domain-containing protein [Halobacteriales archaeon]|nr:PhoU domain-containing protein [Halobacteriales archaeon]